MTLSVKLFPKRKTYLGDVFSEMWMQDSDKVNDHELSALVYKILSRFSPNIFPVVKFTFSKLSMIDLFLSPCCFSCRTVALMVLGGLSRDIVSYKEINTCNIYLM
jgi:cytochrome c biogenesis protein CcdA